MNQNFTFSYLKLDICFEGMVLRYWCFFSVQWNCAPFVTNGELFLDMVPFKVLLTFILSIQFCISSCFESYIGCASKVCCMHKQEKKYFKVILKGRRVISLAMEC